MRSPALDSVEGPSYTRLRCCQAHGFTLSKEVIGKFMSSSGVCSRHRHHVSNRSPLCCSHCSLTTRLTRQVYGFGLSEEFIGEFMRRSGTNPAIATKFAPLPWRFSSGSVVSACKWVANC